MTEDGRLEAIRCIRSAIDLDWIEHDFTRHCRSCRGAYLRSCNRIREMGRIRDSNDSSVIFLSPALSSPSPSSELATSHSPNTAFFYLLPSLSFCLFRNSHFISSNPTLSFFSPIRKYITPKIFIFLFLGILEYRSCGMFQNMARRMHH